MREKEEWDQIAIEQVIQILREENACNLAELEVKISDQTSSSNSYPEPPHILNALQYLFYEGDIKIIQTFSGDFFIIDSLYVSNKRTIDDLINKKYSLYLEYLQMSNNYQLCQKISKLFIYEILVNSSKLIDVRSSTGPADFIGYVKKDKIPFKIKVMNCQKWLYPTSSYLWDFLNFCKESKYLPVPVFRRGSLFSFTLFKQLGVLGYSTKRQFFDPSLEEKLSTIVQVFGFHDITTNTTPSPKDKKFFNEILPRNASAFYNRFMKNADLISLDPTFEVINDFLALSNPPKQKKVEIKSDSVNEKTKKDTSIEGIPIEDVLDDDDLPF